LDNQADFRKENILLGTCSAGGTCVYHSGVKNLVLTITLTDLSGKTIEHKRGYEDEQL
jgi:trimethylamine:corrinoid methyltransferase-like protein